MCSDLIPDHALLLDAGAWLQGRDHCHRHLDFLVDRRRALRPQGHSLREELQDHPKCGNTRQVRSREYHLALFYLESPVKSA